MDTYWPSRKRKRGCDPASLGATDNANTRAINAEDSELDVTSAGTPHPPYSKRLADGMAILGLGEDDD